MEKMSLFIRQAQFVSGGCFYNTEENPFVLNLHKHELFSEMLLIEEGEGEFVIDSKSYWVEPGTLLIYQQGVWHKETSKVYPFRATYLAFKGLKLNDLPEHYFLPSGQDPVIVLGDLFPVIGKLMRECLAIYESGDPEYSLIASNLLGIAFAKLAQKVYYEPGIASVTNVKPGIVLIARRYMEENYRAPVTLDILAAVTFANKYHLAHAFKAEVGVSPIQFLISCRMEAAKHYLQSTGLTVRQIVELIGYQSETSFYKVFLKETGTTPLQYRARNS
ncbi:hypothetical protein Back11_19040 [Paenibacillus baekrokdamisoli]|uniref:Uncharacterized protein n=1 Tax=Paenibacillus baekrokdamisoli TaxID=1712516 RepID=A0A3G9JC83_9BACL|nr:AraC family transcriptional regulator [Paenibacillus baekrokdamisoli]MBB3072502.1 AraC-like DNA-binding protein [Paenibacillus baekrokdamisoli]BBH20559.1 hypothetical protein Back11_19040 [Paenibacillus baekrokdamisoli]